VLNVFKLHDEKCFFLDLSWTGYDLCNKCLQTGVCDAKLNFLLECLSLIYVAPSAF